MVDPVETKLGSTLTNFNASNFTRRENATNKILNYGEYNNAELLNAILCFIGGVRDGSTPVNESEHRSTTATKINFTVPTGKKLFITSCWATSMEGKFFIEFQVDGTVFFSIGIYETGSSFAQYESDLENAFGPFAAGTVIRASREQGDTGKEWSAGFLGFTEDV